MTETQSFDLGDRVMDTVWWVVFWRTQDAVKVRVDWWERDQVWVWDRVARAQDPVRKQVTTYRPTSGGGRIRL